MQQAKIKEDEENICISGEYDRVSQKIQRARVKSCLEARQLRSSQSPVFWRKLAFPFCVSERDNESATQSGRGIYLNGSVFHAGILWLNYSRLGLVISPEHNIETKIQAGCVMVRHAIMQIITNMQLTGHTPKRIKVMGLV